MKGILKAFFTSVVCSAVFLAAAFVYLNMEVKSEKTEAKDYTVPYTQSTPDDCGVLVAFPDESGCLIYFDFTKSSITALFCDDVDSVQNQYKGYSVNYNLEADYDLLSGIIDRCGGIDLDITEDVLRYTGLQITDILSTKVDTNTIRALIAKAVFRAIGENGIDSELLVYVIENSNTDLTVPVCLNWHEYLKDMCQNATVIN